MSFFDKSFNNLQRGAQFQDMGRQLGMHYQARDEFGMVNQLKDFHLFRQGTHRRIKHLLKKEDPMLRDQTAIFDYQYTIHTGNSSATFKQTVFFVESRQLALPQFMMKPEKFFHQIGKFLGLTQDIEFTAHPEFSDKYLVQGEHAELIAGMVPSEMARFFTIEDTWTLEGLGYYLIFYRRHKLLKPETIKAFYAKGMHIVSWLREEAG